MIFLKSIFGKNVRMRDGFKSPNDNRHKLLAPYKHRKFSLLPMKHHLNHNHDDNAIEVGA